MAMVTVYRFEAWDSVLWEMKTGPRKATPEAILRCGGVLIEGTAEEVDETRLDGNGFLRDTVGRVSGETCVFLLKRPFNL